VVVNFVFVAYYDDPDMLGGLGLGMSFYVVFNMAFFIGLNVAITTFGSQLQGMGKIRECGMYLNGGRMLNILMSIPMMIVLGFSYRILISWG
jgi:Na+-driven multidrug efflux pump